MLSYWPRQLSPNPSRFSLKFHSHPRTIRFDEYCSKLLHGSLRDVQLLTERLMVQVHLGTCVFSFEIEIASGAYPVSVIFSCIPCTVGLHKQTATAQM